MTSAPADGRLEIPAEAAFAVTARQFVVSLSRLLGADEATVDDLRLAASELIANAVETGADGPVALSLGRSDGALRLHATGIGSIADDEPISLRRLLESLFDGATFGPDGSVDVAVPLAHTG